MAESMELLFLDTFSHENTEELNLDLVQFPRAVLLQEVRVIPLGRRVLADVPGGVRLGATNPSSFQLELFVNNLGKPNSATFERLGILEYKENVDIQLIPESGVPTDGLVLKGWYTTITVAVYGTLTTLNRDRRSPPPPPPPHRPKPQESRAAVERAPERDPPRQQQHPLDYIEEQIKIQKEKHQLQIQQEALANPPAPATHPQPSQIGHTHPVDDHYDAPSRHPVHIPRDIPVEHVPPDIQSADSRDGHHEVRDPRERGMEPRDRMPDPRERLSENRNHLNESREIVREIPEAREHIPEGRDQSQEARDYREQRDYREFPPEPKEPYRESYDDQHLRDHTDKDYHKQGRMRRNSRDSDSRDPRDYGSSRDSSRDSRDYNKEREYRDREHDRERFRERDKSWEFERERETRELPRSPRPRSPPRQRSPPKCRTPPTSRTPEKSPIKPKSPPRTKSPVKEIIQEDIETANNINIELQEDFIGSLTPDQPIPVYFGLSDGEMQEEDCYENISSDEDMMDELEVPADIQAGYYTTDDSWSYVTACFNPFQSDLTPLTVFSDPSLTLYQLETVKWNQGAEADKEVLTEASSIESIVEKFTSKEHSDKWVEAMESIPTLVTRGLSYLIHQGKYEILNSLVDWALEGLSLEMAMAQPESAYKVRHLKMGIRVAGCLCSSDPLIAMMLLAKDVQSLLLDLYTSEYMSISIKLQIIRSLDQTTCFKDGLDWFLGQHAFQRNAFKVIKEEMSDAETEEKPTCYHRLVEIMLQKQIVRAASSMGAFLRKVNLFEILQKLSLVLEHVVENMSSLDDDVSLKPVEDRDGVDSDMDPAMVNNLSEAHLETIVTCLEEITKIIAQAPTLIGQSKRTLPSKMIFQVRQQPSNPYPNVYHMFFSCHMLESLFILILSPATASQPTIFLGIRDLLQELLSTQSGLLFLSAKPETTNGLIRSLLQMGDYSREESSEDNAFQQLGLELIYHLHTLQFIDQLLEYQKKSIQDRYLDDAEPLGILNNLYTMTFTVTGREAVVDVFSLNNNIQALLPFVELSGDEVRDLRMKKSVCADYATELLLVIVRHSDSLELLKNHAAKLLALSEEKLTSKISEIQEWLIPTRSFSMYSHDGLDTIIEQLKQFSDDVTKLPRGLVTILRVLRQLAVPDESLYCEEKQKELKCRYVLVELFSAECFPLFIMFLQKLSESLLKPWQHGIPHSSTQLCLYLQIIKPSLAMVKAILSYVIMVQGADFRNITSVQALFDLHTVVCSVPAANMLSSEVSKIQRDVIDCLVSYTQPMLPQPETEEALSQSLWTLMMKELLQYTLKAPYCYLSSLILISELLPLPLPMQTREQLTADEVKVVTHSRKLWSAHLYSLTPQLQEIIKTLAGSSCQPLQQVLRRVCWQLSDLAAPTATMVTGCILDLLVDELCPQKSEEKKDGEKEAQKEEEVMKVVSSHGCKLLNLLAFLLSQSAIKNALLHLIRPKYREDEKYALLFNHLLQLLPATSEKESHMQALECIVSIVQILCDPEVTLITGGEGSFSLQEQLTNSLPSRDHMMLLTCALFEHVGSDDQPYSSILPSIRTLIMLTDHDYGFYHVKSAVEKHSLVFCSLLMRINNTFTKDNSDCLSTLSSTLELLRLLSVLDMGEDDVTPIRTFTISVEELQTALCWKNDDQHPLDELKALLVECLKEEDSMESLLENLQVLVAIINGKDEPESRPELFEPLLPSPETLQNLFNLRATYMLVDSDDDERLNPNYWLPSPTMDDADQDSELISCNIEEMIEKYCAGFNLEDELKKGADDEETSLMKPKRPRRRLQDSIRIGKGGGRFQRRPFAPMRGRGMSRGMMQPGRPEDRFRSRPPNTSRPPSMHVDDFVKMETNRQPHQNTSMPPRRTDKDMPVRGRGRGFDRGRGFSTRGRFLTPPDNYSRRDSGASRDGTSYGRSKPTFFSPRPFTPRGRYENQPGSGDRRGGGRDGRFGAPRGRGHWTGQKSKEDSRFISQNIGFRGWRDQGRHVRSFTK